MSPRTTYFLFLSLLIGRISAHLNSLRILYRWEIPLDNHGIAALNNKTNELMGYACASSLNTGSFREEPISITIDPNDPTNRTIKVGAQTFPFHAYARADPSCSLVYNNYLVEVDCQVPRNGSLIPVISAQSDEDCFSKGYERWDLRVGKKFWDTSLAVGSVSGMEEYRAREQAVDRQIRWFWCLTGASSFGFCMFAMIRLLSRVDYHRFLSRNDIK